MNRLAQSPSANAGQRRQKSLGCLGCLPRLVLILFLGVVLIGAITAIFQPWAFYLGGKFNILANWSGMGTLHARNGNYILFVRIGPSKGNAGHGLPGSPVSGLAYLCSPRHEAFRMTLGGGMRRGVGIDTDGEKISLYMYNRPAFSFSGNNRPSIELRGQWHNPNLDADDHGSISRAFAPDGTVYQPGQAHNIPYPGDIVPVHLVPGSYSEFEAACKSPH
jgi:hypothetical protein